MHSLDFTPLFRSTIGFDRLSTMLDSAFEGADRQNSYPPYNIEKRGDDNYRVTLAVAGFAEADLEITQTENTLVVKSGGDDDVGRTYLHRGIAGRTFERRFQLADHIRVVTAALENGLLHIDLEREVPEALKPRTIEITSGDEKRIANAA